MQELSVLQEKHSNRPGVFDDAVEEEQEIEILTQEISQVLTQFDKHVRHRSMQTDAHQTPLNVSLTPA